MFWYPKESSRIVHLPTSELEALRSECQKDVGPDVKLSINDILLAWLLKTSFSTYSSTDKTNIGVSVAANVRKRIPALFKRPYLHNATVGIIVHPWLTISELHQMSTGQIAKRVHNSVASQPTDARIAELTAVATTPSLMPIPYNGFGFYTTNWTQIEFGKISFAGALVKNDQNSSRSGKAVMLLMEGVVNGPRRRMAAMMMKDPDGLWMRWALPDHVWNKLPPSLSLRTR